ELEELRARQLQTQDLVAESSGMRRVLDLTARVARTDSTVLITGESGVGKEVVAKLLHRLSTRREAPLIFVNCGALPETLVESELFGYARGAFTGAREEGKPGLFEVADRGTLVLDEVSELPAGAQAKLLRVIQEREITRVGGLKPRQLDVRVVALSNRDLGQMVQEGTFREDLYYRLNVVPIAVPPLRERREDILPLLRRFLERCGQRYGLRRRFSLEAFRRLERHPWPGNVRELEHVVERAVVLGEGEVIDEAAVETFLSLNGLG
ncbi:MAG: sigma 54-interacting transcriptional regulator, partial [Thermaerobacter sp.]|nr:sigma 54-interacting transcriptional regulator [Thermaerobacter sp.]